MAQVQTQSYAINTQSAAQILAQAASVVKSTTMKAISMLQHTVAQWQSRFASRSPLLAGTIRIQKVKSDNPYSGSPAYRMFLPVF